MAINEMDARLISQGTQVESVGAEALIPVASGEGQPQGNITLANLADSLGKAVPQKQNAEQVTMTGLYAQTSDGKMVQLTKESVAKVMAGLMGSPAGTITTRLGSDVDLNNIVKSGYYTTNKCVNQPSKYSTFFGLLRVFEYQDGCVEQVWQTNNVVVDVFHRKVYGGIWTSWQRIDNFGANTLEELASGVAGVIGMEVLNITVPVSSTLDVGKLYGFFVLRCTTGSGYESFSIAGYANPNTHQILLDGYAGGAKFTDDGHLTIKNPSSATSLTYIGYLMGVQKS